MLSIPGPLRTSIFPACLAFGGAVIVGSVLSDAPDALSMNAGMFGSFSAGVIGFVLARLHGLSFPRALFATMPILGVQAWGFARYGLPILPLLALELMILGLVGLVPMSREEV